MLKTLKHVDFVCYVQPKLIEPFRSYEIDDMRMAHCCMKCPQILREKTSSEKYTVIALKI